MILLLTFSLRISLQQQVGDRIHYCQNRLLPQVALFILFQGIGVEWQLVGEGNKMSGQLEIAKLVKEKRMKQFKKINGKRRKENKRMK